MKHFLFLLVVLAACSPPSTPVSPEVLMEVDREFSEFSKNNGIYTAFNEYYDSLGIRLTDRRMPIVGIKDVMATFQGIDESSSQLVWEPQQAFISASADLGCTYGLYEMRTADSLYVGTYATVWRKDMNGKWKVLLDTGNTGLD